MRLKDLLLGCLLLGLFLKITAEIAKKNPEDDSSKETVSITKWQYCLSCKETVNLYVKLASDEIQSMQKSGKPALSSLEANQLAHFICDHSSFNHFQPWMKFGCMKLMEDHSIDFLQQFAGHVTINDIINKAENYGRKRRICGKYAKACHPSEFKKSNITKSERTKCTACRLIAKDVEDLQRQFKKAATFKNYLSEEYCKQIGYSFHPYLWMEEICEEMVDDHLKDILDILNLQNGIKKTGFSPSESTDYMMCKEFYKCKKNANTNNSNEDFDEDEL